MAVTKIVYDDFYKFIMSAGILLFIFGLGVATFLTIKTNDIEKPPEMFTTVMTGIIVIYCFVGSCGLVAMHYSFKKWGRNQSLIDRKLEAETKQAEINTELSRQELEHQVNERVKKISSSEQTRLKAKFENEMSKIDSKNLNLMRIRYLIEERINQITSLLNFSSKPYSLINSIKFLEERGIYDRKTTIIIQAVISTCNKAIHAHEVDTDEYAFAIDLSEKILFMLEETLINAKKKRP